MAAIKGQNYFDRQRKVPGWDDAKIAEQVCLVFGAGGIGCGVSLCLGRLGVKEIILLDCDTVDDTNLNRQLLFKKTDVGRKKVEAAADYLRESHGGMRTTVTPIHCNVIHSWGDTVLPLFERATAVFNGIDWGANFDAVVAAQCYARGIPYCCASSYAHTAIGEGYSYEQYARLGAGNKLYGAPKSAAAGGAGSSVATSAGATGGAAASSTATSSDAAPAESAVPDERGCWTCTNSEIPATLSRLLLASNTSAAPTIPFVPKDPVPPTGTVGSSVLPCSIASEFAVNLWLNGLFLGGNTLPNQSILSLSSMDITNFPVTPEPGCYVCDPTPQCLQPWGIRALAYGTEPVILSSNADGKVYSFKTPAAGEGAIVSAKDAASSTSADAGASASGGAGGAASSSAPAPALPRLGPVDGKIYEPCIPAHDLDWEAYMVDGPAPRMPTILAKPLLKEGPSKEKGAWHGVRSGTRSAVVFGGSHGKDAYRLKGCNCYILMHADKQPAYPSFPLADMEFHEHGGCQVRGCQFKHTALREQVFAHKIGALLKPHGLLVGNGPMLVHKYELGAADATPAIGKYCGVFTTLGDKRLQTHLLTGLELMLPLLTKVASDEAFLASVLSRFPEDRKKASKAGGQEVIPTYAACIVGSGGKKSPLIDFRAVPLEESAAALATVPDTLVPAFWRPLWDHTVKQLAELLASRPAGSPSLLPYIYARLGREVGAFQRVLANGDISWGYFFDHSPFEPHNNGHPNNLLIVASALAAGGADGLPLSDVPVGGPAKQFLAAVDFDMSFHKSEFLSNFTGAPDDAQFDEYTKNERVEMRRTLGGDEANTGVSLDGAVKRLREAVFDPAHVERIDALAYGLRDTLLIGWQEGWDAAAPGSAVDPKCIHGQVTDPAAERGMQLLVRLALMTVDTINT